jgi:hypothetical protein
MDDQWCDRCDRDLELHATPCGPVVAPRRRAWTRRRVVAVVAWTVTLALPAAAATALWSASGTGDGTSRALTATGLQVSAGTVTADLYPGAAGVVSFSVHNPNGFAVTVNAGTVNAISGITGSAGACTSASFTLGTASVTPTTIAAGGTETVLMTGALTMKVSAGDGCQGAVLAVDATLTGTQA